MMGAGQVDFASVQGANCPASLLPFPLAIRRGSRWNPWFAAVPRMEPDPCCFLVELCDKDALTAHDMWVIMHHCLLICME